MILLLLGTALAQVSCTSIIGSCTLTITLTAEQVPRPTFHNEIAAKYALRPRQYKSLENEAGDVNAVDRARDYTNERRLLPMSNS